MTARQTSLADIDLSLLSAQQKRAIRLADTTKLFRRQGGYGRPPNGVSLDVAGSLIAKSILRHDYSGRQHELVLTGIGRNVLAVLQQRAAMRRPVQ